MEINQSNVYVLAARGNTGTAKTGAIKGDIIKAGSPILEKTYSAETKGGRAAIQIANGTEVFPNLWDPNGGVYTPKKGEIILSYGEAEADWGIQNPKVLQEMEEKGLKSYPDKAVSTEPDLIYRTYEGINGRDLTLYPLKPGEKLDVQKKIFAAPFLFVDEGSVVETLESKGGSGDRVTVGKFQFIQLDVDGNPYVKDIKDLPKRLTPTDSKSRVVFGTVKGAIAKRAEIQEQVESGKISPGLGEKLLDDLWQETLKELKK